MTIPPAARLKRRPGLQYDAGTMRPVLLSLGVVSALALGAATAACGGDDGPDCDCAEVGCFADMCTKTVFVLSEPINADFGGVAAADQLCAQQASAAGLPGVFQAWLGDLSHSPHLRSSQSTVPYTLPDGTMVAEDWTMLTSTGPTVAIDMTAAGTRLMEADDFRVWTGTSREGRADTFNGASNYCANWTSNTMEEFVYIGYLRKRGKVGDWSTGALLACTGLGTVYCFQQ